VRLISALIALLSVSPRGNAAEFTWTDPPETEMIVGTLTMTGVLEAGDHKRFLSALGGREGGGKGYDLNFLLSSKGGNFEEALRIAEVVRDKNLSTHLNAGSVCLSACSIIFMSGRSFNNSFFIKHRSMHPTATLGFHAPTIAARGGGGFDASDIDRAYSSAIEQIGKKLLKLGRYRDESWSNPLIKPSLVNEMMMRRGDNYFYIDTVGKAAEFEIEILYAGGPSRVASQELISACQNAISMYVDSEVSADALEYWLKGDPTRKPQSDSTLVTHTFELNRAKGRFCDVTPQLTPASDVVDRYSIGSSNVVVGAGAEGAGGERQLYVPDWFFWPSDKTLATLPIIEIEVPQ